MRLIKHLVVFLKTRKKKKVQVLWKYDSNFTIYDIISKFLYILKHKNDVVSNIFIYVNIIYIKMVNDFFKT